MQGSLVSGLNLEKYLEIDTNADIFDEISFPSTPLENHSSNNKNDNKLSEAEYCFLPTEEIMFVSTSKQKLLYSPQFISKTEQDAEETYLCVHEIGNFDSSNLWRVNEDEEKDLRNTFDVFYRKSFEISEDIVLIDSTFYI